MNTRTRPTLALRTPEGLRAWRATYGLSQPDLAKLLEVTTQTVYRWEAGAVAIPRTVELALLYLAGTLRRKRRPNAA
jgi:DNA-binding transcriptional regulator YiaG